MAVSHVHDACAHGDVDELRLALELPFASVSDAEEDEEVHYPPIHTLLRCFNTDEEARLACARMLIRQGASANACQYLVIDERHHGLCTALQLAARHGASRIMELLLDANADVNGRTGVGSTALAESVARAHLECVILLIARGADVSISWSFSSDDNLGPSPIPGTYTALGAAIRSNSGPRAPRIRRIIPILLRAGGWRNFPLELVPDRLANPAPGHGHRLPPTDIFFQRIEHLQRIVAAGSWPDYERNHRATLAATFAPKLPHRLPSELVSHVVTFWAHVGFY